MNSGDKNRQVNFLWGMLSKVEALLVNLLGVCKLNDELYNKPVSAHKHHRKYIYSDLVALDLQLANEIQSEALKYGLDVIV